ncbi:MAG: glycosyltransferase family A protein [Lentisphaeria bacterium]|nr:glycosyltransferase family A protein [Lentisphaeria bacterium]
MLVSAVIPLFNKKDFVKRAIESVLEQTLTDFELIVVDDGSTDGSAEAVSGIQDPRITLLKQHNAGVSVARNTGVAKCKGKYVAFLDADDQWRSTFLERTLAVAQSRPGVVAVGTNFQTDTKSKCCENPPYSTVYTDEYLKLSRQYKYSLRLLPSATLVSKKAIILAGLFPPGIKIYEDPDTWMRLSWLGTIAYVPEVLSFFHDQTPGNTMTGKRFVGPDYPIMAKTFRLSLQEGNVPDRLVEDTGIYVRDCVMYQSKVLLQEKRAFCAFTNLWRNRDMAAYGNDCDYERLMLQCLTPKFFHGRLARLSRILKRCFS